MTRLEANKDGVRSEDQRRNNMPERMGRGRRPMSDMLCTYIKGLNMMNEGECRVGRPAAIWSFSFD